MKLPNAILKLKSKYTRWKLNAYTSSELNYPKIANSTIALEPRLFEEMNVAKACIYYIDCPAQNLIELISILETTISEIKSNTIVSKAVLTKSAPITIENFFKDITGKYVNANLALTIFKELSIEYFINYKNLEIHTLGVEGHNYRILAVFTTRLSTLTDTLLDYCYG